jgi:hypothetical protein
MVVTLIEANDVVTSEENGLVTGVLEEDRLASQTTMSRGCWQLCKDVLVST